jgi:hypothetical protein
LTINMKISHLLSLAIALFLTVSAARAADPQYEPLGPSIAGIDHIPLAVRDLEQASDAYRSFGFTLKPGRLHDDGIRNNHVKFKDGSGISWHAQTTAAKLEPVTGRGIQRQLATGLTNCG